MFSLNTNVTSLQAQNYLNKSSNFQSQTINEVTSGLRIVNSGDDAAGLAIANGLRSAQAVLTQGIRNANDGLSTLQTIDGGMNNISNLLDRASTLATQSASGTFTGDRSVLNNEFQSVLTEINRQSQAIGLNTGGQFAKALSVFIGGGTASGNVNAISNGSVSVDLTHSTVDTQSLGLSGYSATGNTSVDIGTGAGTTSVSNILANSTNQGTESQSGFTELYFSGPGFSANSGATRIGVSVNLSGVTDVNSLVSSINSAITAAAGASSQQATAFKNAGISASVYTDAAGASHLRFTSSNSAFQVEAGDGMANALLGNLSSGSTGQSVAAAVTATSANVAASAAVAETVKLVVNLGGTATTAQVNIAGTEASANALLADVNTGLTTAGLAVTASINGSGKLVFTANNSAQAQSLSVQASGDSHNYLGLGTFAVDGSGNASYTTTVGIGEVAAAAGGTTQNLELAIGNQTATFSGLTVGASEAASLTVLNNAFQGNALTRAAGITAVDDGAGKIAIKSNNSTAFRFNAYGASDGGHVGFGIIAADTNSVTSAATATLSATAETGSISPSLDANGVSTSGFLNFTGIAVAGNSQTVSITAPDASGTSHSISLSLTSSNSGNIDNALSYINTQLLQSNDSTLQKIVAVKDQSSGVDGIRFVSSNPSFQVSLGTTATGTATAGAIEGISNGTGVSSQGGPIIASSSLGTGSTADISSLTNAENAVTALASAVTNLGVAQAAVGKGENQFNYAVNLAQSQVTNEAAAESRIRDADLAAEAANLSKAQILVQAGTAALAQANSAPQAVLSLLRG